MVLMRKGEAKNQLDSATKTTALQKHVKSTKGTMIRGSFQPSYQGKPENVRRKKLLTKSDNVVVVSWPLESRLRSLGIRSCMSSPSPSSLESGSFSSEVLYSRVDDGFVRFRWRTLMSSSVLERRAVNSTSSLASSGDIPTFELRFALSIEIFEQRPSHGSITL